MKHVCRKLPFVTAIAGVKQSAKVHGPLALLSRYREQADPESEPDSDDDDQLQYPD